MSGNLNCPACVIRVVDPGGPGEWRDPSCTGRPGCVRHPERETPASDGAPAGADVPDGKADIVERLRGAYDRVRLWPENSPTGMHDLLLLRNLTPEAADEIARLRAENERLTRDHDAVCRAIPDRFLLDPPDGGTVYPEEAIQRMVADRAALAHRVAEAVRDACKQAVIGTYGDARNHHRMDAIDLAAVLAGVKTGEEG